MNYIKNTGILTVHYKRKICSFNIQLDKIQVSSLRKSKPPSMAILSFSFMIIFMYKTIYNQKQFEFERWNSFKH